MWQKFIRWLFLVKEIISKLGQVHFRRYRLLETPWLRIYIHQILISDYDAHFHDHPWHFESRILSGSYREDCTYHPKHSAIHSGLYEAGDTIRHDSRDAHRLTLQTPEVWTFVIAWGKRREWGYRLDPDTWMSHESYRTMKNEGKLI